MGGAGVRPVDRLLAATSDDERCRAGTAVLEELFDSPSFVYEIDGADRHVLRSTSATAIDASNRTLPLADHVLGEAVRESHPRRIDDCTDTRSAAASESGAGTYRSVLLVPIADWGLLVVADEAPAAFDDRDLAVADLVGSVLGGQLRATPAASSVADDRIGTVGSVLSHDLTTPIAIGRGCIEDAMETGDLERLDTALRALDRIDEITDGLAQFARTGEEVDSTRPIEIGEAAEVAWSMVEHDGCRLEVDSNGALLADEPRLYQLLENLFSNAVEHGRPPVTVRVGVLEGRAGFFVEDDGPGVPVDARETIFEHGYSDAEGHSGFGLSIVRSIVRAHGWSISVGDGEAGGARFEISGVEPSATGAT